MRSMLVKRPTMRARIGRPKRELIPRGEKNRMVRTGTYGIHVDFQRWSRGIRVPTISSAPHRTWPDIVFNVTRYNRFCLSLKK